MTKINIGGSTITYNGAIPSSGAQSVKTDIGIGVGIKTLVDMSHQYSLGKMQGVQTLYIDLSELKHDVVVHMPDTGQRIKAYAGTQGYYPVLSTTIMRFEVSGNNKDDSIVPIHFINFPIALGVWRAISIETGGGGNSGGNGGNTGGGSGSIGSLPFANFNTTMLSYEVDGLVDADGYIKVTAVEEYVDDASGLFEFGEFDPEAPEWEREVPVYFKKRGAMLVSATIKLEGDVIGDTIVAGIGGESVFENDGEIERRFNGIMERANIYEEPPQWEGGSPLKVLRLNGIIYPPRPTPSGELPQLIVALQAEGVNITAMELDFSCSLLEEW